MGNEGQTFKWIGTRPIRPDGVDKVTGRAAYSADFELPGMLEGAILRSPHAHANIRSINADKAAALPGVKAVITAEDFPAMEAILAKTGEAMTNYRDLSCNVMARGKALYDGHAIAAVAATSVAIAKQALALIEVDYEVLPPVMTLDEAMKGGATVLHDDLFTGGVEPKPETASNIAKKIEMGIGDVEAGFAAADHIIEQEYDTAMVHQGYIEPHGVVASANESDQAVIWGSSQGQFMVREFCAHLVGVDIAQIRVIPAEIGGGFGGKTTVYVEPVALRLSQLTGRPVKIVMSREEVFRATGPAPGSKSRIKIGIKNDGTITAGEAEMAFEAGGFPGSAIGAACMTAFACYDLENVKVTGYDVVVNRPKSAAYRAPGAPQAAFAVESVVDELAQKIGIDPIDLRLKNAAKEGTQAAYGPKFKTIGMIETLEAAQQHPNYQAELGPNQGRGVASGFWFNIGGNSTAAVHINEDGTAMVMSPNPDIGGSRASMAMMAAEVLGLDYNKIDCIVADTSSIGTSDVTGGSRVTFSIGMAVIQAAEAVIEDMKGRAAKIWEVEPDAVIWEDGHAKPAGANVGEFDPLSIADIAAQAGRTGGPISSNAALNARGAGPGFGTHVCDVEVDPETGYVTVLRYLATQDVGRAIHPSYVEGQLQGGVAQGVGWALNEEYIYNGDGQMQNTGFLDYRMPVASDLPMLDTALVEVPNPSHPYGVRGVGEVPIVPPLAAVANAVSAAVGKRMTSLPLSPPRIIAALND
jgi:CO/xanthine dehydrogenase Mo-binding subunit